MSWIDEDGREFFDLFDPADRERFDAAVDALPDPAMRPDVLWFDVWTEDGFRAFEESGQVLREFRELIAFNGLDGPQPAR